MSLFATGAVVANSPAEYRKKFLTPSADAIDYAAVGAEAYRKYLLSNDPGSLPWVEYCKLQDAVLSPEEVDECRKRAVADQVERERVELNERIKAELKAKTKARHLANKAARAEANRKRCGKG